MAGGLVKSVTSDPRYVDFVKRYAFDANRFAIEVCGVVPTWQQKDMFDSVSPSGSRTSVSSGHGCFAKGTSIMRGSGVCVPVESVKVGDVLMGPDGKSRRNVLELKRGQEAMYRFTYMDGTSHVFNESHILCLVATNSKGRRVAGEKTTVTVREYLKWGYDKRRCHAIYRSPVETFDTPANPLPIPAYMLGVWLGDGHSSGAQITTADPEIEAAIDEYAASVGCNAKRQHSPNCGAATTIHITNGRMGRNQNPMSRALIHLGILNDKHVPDAYLYADRETRLNLLAGLIDTDGHFDSGSTGYEITQKKERLARQIAWLARSVGCHSTIKEVTKTCGNNGVSGQYWRVTIGRNVGQIPVRIERKKRPDVDNQRPNLHFGIRTVEPLGEGDYYGFVLDGDSRFLGGDFTVLHNTGKTSGYGMIAIWHLLCFVNSNTYLSAPKLKTLQEGVWKEIADAKARIEKGPHAWIADYFIVEAERVFVAGHKMQWFVACRTAPRGSPENLAGTHRDWLLWLIDEASGVPDANFGVIGGALTDARNRMCLASQPTRPSGFFYDTHHSLSTDNGGPWNALVFNSEDSPLVSDTFILNKLMEYGGEDSVEYQIKVQGRFPENSDEFLLGRKAVERVIGAKPCVLDADPWGYILTVDVAAGEYRDKSVMTLARVTGYADYGEDVRRVDVVKVPLYSNTRNLDDLSGEVFTFASQLPNCTVLIDAGGMGIAVCQRLEALGLPNVVRVKWGLPCFKTRYKERFLNQRAQASVLAARAVKEGRLTLPAEHRKEILDQATRIPYHFDEKARYVIEKKEKMKADGIPSPDLWDTICFFFLEDASYMIAEGHGLEEAEDRAANARDRALADLADIE